MNQLPQTAQHPLVILFPEELHEWGERHASTFGNA